ncbi:MAG: hypothetical protein WBF66_08720, partial [Dehalococcoidia bacterium]
MARWTIVGTGHEPTLTTLYVVASTSVEDHLFMSWALYRPAQHEIWRRVRGKRIFCGYQYIWDTPNLEEQTPAGNTLAHWFYLTGIPAGSEVWYYLHAPNPPSLYETQGPLMHVHLLVAPSWCTRAYFASRTKGMFRTTDFSGPGGPQPTWTPDNAGLPSYDIAQACPDPFDAYHRRFVICHGDVYRMDNNFIDRPSTATRVLAQWEAAALCETVGGDILWIAPNHNYPGHFYVLFMPPYGQEAAFCLRTLDYGASWTAHLIEAEPFHYRVCNILAGVDQGSSPHPAGHVLYTHLILHSGGEPFTYRSFDEGETWTPTPSNPPGAGIWRPRLYIETADQSILYLGSLEEPANLYRTLDHGDTWQLCDGGNNLGIHITPTADYGTMGTPHSDPSALRVLTARHIWQSSNFGIIWRDQGQTQY